MARLPKPGGDDNTWGDVLNTFLDVAHNTDGSLKPSAVSGAGAERTANKGKPSGYASLDSGGNVPTSQLGNSPAAPVSSVAGKTGAVTLGESDVANLSSDLAATEKTGNKGAASGYAPLDSSSKVPTTNLPDATTSTKGAVQLAGDLGGTASTPKISKLQGTDLNGSSPADGQVLTYDQTAGAWVPGTVSSTTVNDATAGSKGIVQLDGDLGGTASSPTVPGLASKADASAIIPKSTVTTKGDLIAGTGAAAVARLGAGSDGEVLVADSTQSTGLNWTSAVSDANVVHLAGSESITGAKTFGTNPVFNDGAIPEAKVANLSTDLAATEKTANKGAASGYAPLDGSSLVPLANLPPASSLGNIPESQVTNLTSDLATTEKTANKGAASGYAPLDGSSKVPVANLPSLPESQVTGLVSDLASKASIPATAIYYVDPTNGNDSSNGKSWGSAFATIAKAISSLAGNPGVVQLGPGQYQATATQNLVSNLTLRAAAGLGSVTIQLDPSAPLGTRVLFGQDKSNVHIEDIIFDLNKANVTQGAGNTAQMAVYFFSSATGVTNCSIRRCIIKNGWYDGIHCDSANSALPLEVAVQDCPSITNNKVGINMRLPTGMMVTGCNVSGNVQDGIYNNAGTSARIEANTCNTNGRHGIVAGDNGASNVEVIGNICNANGGAVANQGWGIVASVRCSNFNIVGNICDGNYYGGITADLSDGGTPNLLQPAHGTITGNTCTGAQTFHGIYVTGCDGVTVVGNTCFGNTSVGIQIVARSCTVVGNTSYSNAYGLAIQFQSSWANGAGQPVGAHLLGQNNLHDNSSANFFENTSCDASTNARVYTTLGSNTHKVPVSGTYKMMGLAAGGSGGAGGSGNAANPGGGGGGQGGWFDVTQSLLSGTQLNITVPGQVAGGNPGAAGGSVGGNGTQGASCTVTNTGGTTVSLTSVGGAGGHGGPNNATTTSGGGAMASALSCSTIGVPFTGGLCSSSQAFAGSGPLGPVGGAGGAGGFANGGFGGYGGVAGTMSAGGTAGTTTGTNTGVLNATDGADAAATSYGAGGGGGGGAETGTAGKGGKGGPGMFVIWYLSP